MILYRKKEKTYKHEMLFKDTAMGVEKFNGNTRRSSLILQPDYPKSNTPCSQNKI